MYLGYGGDNIKVHHNISIENAGFLEPEALDNTRGNNNLEIYSNFSDDYKWFICDDDLNRSTVRNNTSLRVLPWQKPLEFVLIIQGVENRVLNNVFIVANNLTTTNAGFGSDTNEVTILWPGGEVETLPLETKDLIAMQIWDRVERLLQR